ncbi:hypothetical protein ACOME3_002194 [Neoechinorhynchus agilis]
MAEGDVSRHSIWCQFDQQLGAAEPTDKERARLWDVRWGDEGCYRAPLARVGDPLGGWVTGLFISHEGVYNKLDVLLIDLIHIEVFDERERTLSEERKCSTLTILIDLNYFDFDERQRLHLKDLGDIFTNHH